jgi:hypothetical protein
MTESCCAVKPAPEAVRNVNKVAQYKPLIIVALLAFAVSAALALGRGLPWMDMLMGSFLGLIALLKLFDVKGFAVAFARYDLVAGRVRSYGLVYPLFELALSVLYFGGFAPVFTNAATLALIGLGTVGVLKAVLSGANVQCGCVGTGFNLTVGRVTLAENAAMMAMAAINLWAL